MIPDKTLLEHFQRMNEEHWPYEWGKAEEGSVDCSGAFVWAYRQEGESIYHGSNRIARSHIISLLPISEAKPGMAAFKARQPGEDYYALPQGYQPGGGHYNGDLNDYHHIGLVDEDPRFILNAKSTAEGFKRSPISEDWDFVAYLSDVDYGEQEGNPVAFTALVTAPTGSTVNMRARPSSSANLVDRLPIGTPVSVLQTAKNDAGEEWSQVVYDDRTGYMMTKFLRIDSAPEIPSKTPEELPSLEEFEQAVLAKLDALIEAVNRLAGGAG